MLGTAAEQATSGPLVTDSAGVLALLLGSLGLIFWAKQQAYLQGLFRAVPALVFCYFIPTLLTTLGVLPEKSTTYNWIQAYVLPASLVLLILALDVPAILRLGPKALVMMLAGTAGIVVGGPVALLICGPLLPENAWRGMAALSGSWIGGAANYVAMGKIAETPPEMMAAVVIPDVFMSNLLTILLLFLAARHAAVDRWLRADNGAIRDLQDRLTAFHARTARPATLPDIMVLLGLAFVASWVSALIAQRLPEIGGEQTGTLISHTTWKFLVITTGGVILSFTRVRNLEGVGASQFGTVMLYLLVASIGATANFHGLIAAPQYVLMGAVWMSVHLVVLFTVGRLIRAPVFYIAVASQANVGGAASAPVVAGAFHESLAPVGVLLAILGYVLGTYCGIICLRLLMWIAGAHAV